MYAVYRGSQFLFCWHGMEMWRRFPALAKPAWTVHRRMATEFNDLAAALDVSRAINEAFPGNTRAIVVDLVHFGGGVSSCA